ncbi:MAG: hypothetical protein HC878_03455 [Leptolyngbyaceae cyanobacterium SL_5_14]|nr:hypothetical protein [Leptolyngbyaceae cyanobacterium SL_5_14]NJO66142.1 hypothetical protein [Leptolyngbyaceae cyanobacterium RM1_405_57]
MSRQIDSKQIADVREALLIWIETYLTDRPTSMRLIMVAIALETLAAELRQRAREE